MQRALDRELYLPFQVSFPALELMPPVTFSLCSGEGPVFISAQHITREHCVACSDVVYAL